MLFHNCRRAFELYLFILNALPHTDPNITAGIMVKVSSCLLGALSRGLIVGAIPATAGGVKGKLKFGLGDPAACVAASFILGMILSIPICAVFMYLIYKKDPEETHDYSTFHRPRSYGHTTSVPKHNHSKATLSEQIENLIDLRGCRKATRR